MVLLTFIILVIFGGLACLGLLNSVVFAFTSMRMSICLGYFAWLFRFVYCVIGFCF